MPSWRGAQLKKITGTTLLLLLPLPYIYVYIYRHTHTNTSLFFRWEKQGMSREFCWRKNSWKKSTLNNEMEMGG
jgi:hypothetical protein